MPDQESNKPNLEKIEEELQEVEDEIREAEQLDDGLFDDAVAGADVVIDGKRQNLGFNWKKAEPWQRKRMVGSFLAVAIIFVAFLIITCGYLISDKLGEESYWQSYLHEETPELQAAVDEFSQDATHVETAVYLEQVRSIDIKSSQFTVVLRVGYRWHGHPEIDFSDPSTVHFYKGSIGNVSLRDDYHEGDLNYQCVSYTVTINKEFWTPRFPLESHQMRVYLEPTANVNVIVLDPVQDECYYNPSLSITGFELTRFAVTQNIIAENQPLLNPIYSAHESGQVYKTEILSMFEVDRAGIGLYIKCCIALYGTLAWILLCLYIATFRRVDALGMIGAAFFGAVSNVMVGSNLLPDALQMGLVEFVNFFGVGIIVASTAVVISINTIRKEIGNESFAQFYGRIMLCLFAALVIIGNIALPLSAMNF